ncbi:MAG: Na-translocating system protein MpsC family protein [Thermodesulfobacteriota bacterium]
MTLLPGVPDVTVLAESIGRLYGDAMGRAPERVEVCLSPGLLSALLCDCVCPAEAALGSEETGSRILREYHDACAGELKGPLDALARRTVGQGVVCAWLTSAPGTRHKVLFAVLT